MFSSSSQGISFVELLSLDHMNITTFTSSRYKNAHVILPMPFEPAETKIALMICGVIGNLGSFFPYLPRCLFYMNLHKSAFSKSAQYYSLT